MFVWIEFLKICFLDVDIDLMNVLLIFNGGDMMKVVDELLVSGSVEENSEDMEVVEEDVFLIEFVNFLNLFLLVVYSIFFNFLNEEEKFFLFQEMSEVIDFIGGFNY